jgi:hypothetical protein
MRKENHFETTFQVLMELADQTQASSAASRCKKCMHQHPPSILPCHNIFLGSSARSLNHFPKFEPWKKNFTDARPKQEDKMDAVAADRHGYGPGAASSVAATGGR